MKEDWKRLITLKVGANFNVQEKTKKKKKKRRNKSKKNEVEVVVLITTKEINSSANPKFHASFIL